MSIMTESESHSRAAAAKLKTRVGPDLRAMPAGRADLVRLRGHERGSGFLAPLQVGVNCG